MSQWIRAAGAVQLINKKRWLMYQLKLWWWQLRTWWRQTHCAHKNATEIFRYPPDNYIVYRCHDCDKEIFDDLHPN